EVPMYDNLLEAEVVIADVSTSNRDAYYELGVRHGLRPYTTIVISEDAVRTFPFDVNHVLVHRYHHMGDGIHFDEVVRFRDVLKNVLVELTKATPHRVDSPVYNF